MNRQRRKQIDSLLKRIENELNPLISDITDQIEEIRDEEQDYYDNMPESFQMGEKGDLAQEAIDALEAAASEIDGCDFDQVITSLGEAAQ